ncbi:MAG TPA: nucleotide exchange factor GrpE [Patescibacteria group bacterium]|nr:nucleotide exchange factor GrpE [Patescibacteria group bacterium]
MSPKSKKQDETNQALADLTADLQRIQADFVNYRNRQEDEKQRLIDNTRSATVKKLLPLVDDVERAVSHTPTELTDNTWAKGVASLPKQLEKALADLDVERIVALDQPFDPELHEAVQMLDGEGEHEVVVEELRAGYKNKRTQQVIRPSMVKVGRN